MAKQKENKTETNNKMKKQDKNESESHRWN